MTREPSYCAIDFGTSNSAVVVPDAGSPRGLKLVTLEDGRPTMPTAVFHDSEDGSRRYGRAAIAAYIEGHEGRLMRSLKSILGSPLVSETTSLGDGIAVRYIDVIGGFLKELKRIAEHERGAPLTQVVLGRPVYFVDDDPAADRKAEEALRDAAFAIGFDEVAFQMEPIAAALDYESRLSAERLVLVADIGGGTSDFTIIRLGGDRRADRTHDVLANHGVHIAGTDFDQRVELEAILTHLGFRARTPEGREVPNKVYHEIATWHLINGIYAPRRMTELKDMRWFYADQAHHRRLMTVIDRRLGHRLLGRAEDAKIALSSREQDVIDLSEVEPDLSATFDRSGLEYALRRPLAGILAAARETVRLAGIDRDAIGAVYFTGGSTGLEVLSSRLLGEFPDAEAVFGDRYSSVASGLGIDALARYRARTH